jgi:ABC-type phosphate/phosphonate transport system substrate-binding protein
VSAPLASLAMYDWPEVAGANDALWAFLAKYLAQRGIDAPDRLIRDRRCDTLWTEPDLLLAQCCGYPYATQLRGSVQLVATPVYDVDGCDGANYCSLIIARADGAIRSLSDLGTATAAVNSKHSQSGHWALRAALAADAAAVAPARVVQSGGHRQSLLMVADGTADVAAIDAVCWALALAHEPAATAKLRVIARSPMAPGLPFISGRHTPPQTMAALREGLALAMAEPSFAKARSELRLKSIQLLPDEAYDRILRLKMEALKKPFPPLP